MDSTVTPFEFQVAGHHFSEKETTKMTMLISRTDGFVLKPMQKPPRGDREVEFYESVWSVASSHPLQKLIPRYYGLTDIANTSYLRLENLCDRMTVPCVLDVKIGVKNCGPDATEEKLRIDLLKYKWATTLGFRFLGYKTFRHVTLSYFSRDKKWGKSVAPESVITVLSDFFQSGSSRISPVVQTTLSRLRSILSWFETQTEFVFFSSSILICYDGAELAVDQTSLVNVKMIDFSHVFPAESFDHNYLFGLRNLIRYVEEFLTLVEQNAFSNP